MISRTVEKSGEQNLSSIIILCYFVYQLDILRIIDMIYYCVINTHLISKRISIIWIRYHSCVEQYFRVTFNSHSCNFSRIRIRFQTGLEFDWRFERPFGNARFSRRHGTRRYVFQMMWSFQDGPASVLPLTQTLSNIYGRRSASPDVPGPDVDEIQVRKRAKCKSKLRIFETCLLPRQVLSLQTKTCSTRFVK